MNGVARPMIWIVSQSRNRILIFIWALLRERVTRAAIAVLHVVCVVGSSPAVGACERHSVVPPLRRRLVRDAVQRAIRRNDDAARGSVAVMIVDLGTLAAERNGGV